MLARKKRQKVTHEHNKITLSKHVALMVVVLGFHLEKAGSMNFALTVDFLSFFAFCSTQRQACEHFLMQELYESLTVIYFRLNMHDKVY
jgi:hypothetical protein